MNMITLLILFIFMICSCLIMIVNLISNKTSQDREKFSPFECGFDPKTSARLPFSLHFFLIGVIFLIFDIEIVLLLPFIISFKITNIFSYFTLSIMFLFILIIGLYHEWNQNALTWVN
uniref:NADH-ubiquinone oxidoreductase chain 3 n=1 Tax=Pelecotoma fennica TaxID=433262 RepID=A0A343A485_9CUCU|nr:NADH dehydrogenase subunit 3 [Pelecotoma fennica]AOY39363.1 NADH dehydrogenase subunit 3 [Pelecotoma fennica]